MRSPALFALCVPLLGIYPVFMMKLLCFAMFACAYNLLLGFGRMLSFGHAAFFGSAAYATAWLVDRARLGHGAGDPRRQVVAAALLGLVVGGLAIRRHGIYFAMITLALGAAGVFRVPRGAVHRRRERSAGRAARQSVRARLPLRSDRVLYYLVLAAFVAVFLFIRRVVHSPFGQVLKAIRENEPRAISLGYDINRYKLLAFVLSAALAGLGRSAEGTGARLRDADDVQQSTSGEVILMTLLGGTGTFFGPVVGAAIVVTLQQYLSDLVGGWVTAIIGAIFVACVLSFRRGIVGEIVARQARR